MEADKKGNIGCSVTRCVRIEAGTFNASGTFFTGHRNLIYKLFIFFNSSTAERKSRTSIVTKGNKFCLKHNALSEVRTLSY